MRVQARKRARGGDLKEETVKLSEYEESNLNSRIKIRQVLSALWSSWWRLDKICI